MAEFTEAEGRFIEASAAIFELRKAQFNLEDRMEAAQLAGDDAALALRNTEHPDLARSEELLWEAVGRVDPAPDSRLARMVKDSLDEAHEIIAMLKATNDGALNPDQVL